MSEWSEKTLSDLGVFARGKSKHRPRDAAHLYGGPYPFIQTGDVKAANHVITNYSQTYSEAGLAQSKLWPAGTLCITIAANIAETGILSFPACFPDSVIGFSADPKKSNVDFVEYLLQFFRQRVQKQAIGSVQDNINLGTFQKFAFMVPELPVQEAIAEILSSLDEKIELNRKQNRTLEGIAQALFKRWFVEFEFPDENGRPYKSSGGAMQPSELGEIPVGWEVKCIGDFVDVTDYVANGSFESLRNNVSLYDEPEYALFIRATDYKGGFVGNLKYTDNLSYEFLRKTVLTGNEVIISNVGDIGSVFRPPVWLDQPMTLGSNLIALRSEFNPYLFQLFRSRYGQFLISGLVGGSAQPKFNKTEFRSLKVVLPSNKLFKEYAEIEMALWDKQIMCNREVRTLSQLRDTLLPKLMSGELRIT